LKTTDAHSGQFAAIVQYHHNPQSGYNPWGNLFYATGQIGEGHPFAGRPDKMTFWYKYILNTPDTALCYVVLKKWDGTMQQPAGAGYFTITTNTPVYTKAVVPIQYYIPGTPDSIVILFSSGNLNTMPQTARLYIDDIQFEYPSAVQNLAASSRFRPYPNPLGDVLTIEHEATGSYNIRVSNMAGTQLIVNEAANNTSYTNTAFLPKGMYFVTIRDKEGVETFTLVKE
jgi:hypothetical protein